MPWPLRGIWRRQRQRRERRRWHGGRCYRRQRQRLHWLLRAPPCVHGGAGVLLRPHRRLSAWSPLFFSCRLCIGYRLRGLLSVRLRTCMLCPFCTLLNALARACFLCSIAGQSSCFCELLERYCVLVSCLDVLSPSYVYAACRVLLGALVRVRGLCPAFSSICFAWRTAVVLRSALLRCFVCLPYAYAPCSMIPVKRRAAHRARSTKGRSDGTRGGGTRLILGYHLGWLPVDRRSSWLYIESPMRWTVHRVQRVCQAGRSRETHQLIRPIG